MIVMNRDDSTGFWLWCLSFLFLCSVLCVPVCACPCACAMQSNSLLQVSLRVEVTGYSRMTNVLDGSFRGHVMDVLRV